MGHRVMALAAVVAVGALPGVCLAGASKLADNMIHISTSTGTGNPALVGPFSSAFTNGASKGTSVFDSKCNVSISLSGLTGIPDSDTTPSNGDEIICLDEGQSNLGASNTAVFRLNVKKGKASRKLNVGTCTPCGLIAGVQAFDQRVTCYAPDPAYNPTLSLACPTPNTKEGVVAGAFAARPSTGIVATLGLFFP